MFASSNIGHTFYRMANLLSFVSPRAIPRLTSVLQLLQSSEQNGGPFNLVSVAQFLTERIMGVSGHGIFMPANESEHPHPMRMLSSPLSLQFLHPVHDVCYARGLAGFAPYHMYDTIHTKATVGKAILGLRNFGEVQQFDDGRPADPGRGRAK